MFCFIICYTMFFYGMLLYVKVGPRKCKNRHFGVQKSSFWAPKTFRFPWEKNNFWGSRKGFDMFDFILPAVHCFFPCEKYNLEICLSNEREAPFMCVDIHICMDMSVYVGMCLLGSWNLSNRCYMSNMPETTYISLSLSTTSVWLRHLASWLRPPLINM